MAAGNVPDCVSALIAAIDGMGVVMNIHAQWMLGIIDNITVVAQSGIPRDYDTAISSHKEQIIWSVIKQDIHNYVADLICLESTFFGCLSLLYKSSLLDDASERKRHALARTVQMHKLYVSSVSAVDTILHKVMPLRTSRARQDKYDMWPRRNCVPVSVCSVFMTLYVYLQVFKVLQRNERPWRTTTLGSCAQMAFESNCRRREKLRGGLHRFLGSESRQVILQVG